MNITELLTKDTIILNLKADTKSDVLAELADQLQSAGKLANRKEFLAAIHAREEQSTTGIGEGIAIPHAKTSAVKQPAIAFGRCMDGVDFNSLDGQPAKLFFMIAATDGANNLHLDALSRLATFLMDSSFTEILKNATSIEEILQAIDVKENENKEKEALTEVKAEPAKQTTPAKKLLAVTACPTGIAHTYMAAEKLQEVAKQLGAEIKVETNGSGGVKNKLTATEITEADVIIIAADTNVEMARFNGKPVIQTKVGKAIYEADALVEKAMKGDTPIYHHNGTSSSNNDSDGEKFGGFYKHLMNGVSNMLPFVVGGGILIALSFFWGINSADPNSTEYNEFAAMLKTIGGGNAFYLMVPVLAGFIAMSIADRPGFAPGMVGGLLAITVTNADGASSGFLGGLIAGFLAGYLVVGLKKIFAILPKSMDGLKPILFYPLFGIGLTGFIMMSINPVLTSLYTTFSSFLNGLSGSNMIFLGIVLGGMMAIDMGGPVNKAAYTFGVAMLDAGNYEIMAAVMAGGMVPPIGIALATTLFKSKFTKQEREAGKTAYVLGACFISEGAIPFAASDPVRIIPSFVVGAAVTGALSMLFEIGLRAPHGGVFVFGLVEGGLSKALLYIVAILIGSLISAIMVGYLKPKRTV